MGRKKPTAVVIAGEREMVRLDSIQPHPRNPRQGDVKAIVESIKANGFYCPLVVQRSTRYILAGNHRWLAARELGMAEIPVIWVDCDDARALRILLADNRTSDLACYDDSKLAELLEGVLGDSGSLSGTGFDANALQELLEDLGRGGMGAVEGEDIVPEPPIRPASRLGDLWLLGPHRVLCGDATSPEAVGRLLGDRKPFLMITDPPYGIGLDSEWRDRAGLNSAPGKRRSAVAKMAAKANPMYPAEASYMKHRSEGHTETTISGDTRADWSEAFALVPSLEVAYVWHASKFTREVLDGLLRIGFLHHQQLIWNKGRAVLTRTHYWFQHEPCWYVRKKNAPWYGKAGENSTVWDSASPKFIMGGSDEQKFDHPTQKPVELIRRPLLNHTKRGEGVYDAFLGSGTTLAAAELTERVCYGLELDPRYVDVTVRRWQELTGKQATLDGDGRTFDDVAAERRPVPAGKVA
jgi:DNA modification methylase